MFTQETRDTFELVLTNRVFLYTLLYKTFGREPDRAILEILSGDAAADAFSLLSAQPGDTMDKASAFVRGLADKAQDEAYIDRLRYEYMRMFIGPEKLVAPPWESVYRNKEGLLFQESTLTIREIYRKQGYLPEGYPNVPDDSLALELDFMSRMATRSLQAMQQDDRDTLLDTLKVQESFLRVHLLYFVPKLMERMTDSSLRMLYPQMTKILIAFLEIDHELITEIMNAA